jgi:hypothetical protein
MKKFPKRLAVLAVVNFLILGLFPDQSYAYIDLGTGSYIVQIIIATIVSSVVLIKMFFQKITHFFTRVFKRDKGQQE